MAGRPGSHLATRPVALGHQGKWEEPRNRNYENKESDLRVFTGRVSVDRSQSGRGNRVDLVLKSFVCAKTTEAPEEHKKKSKVRCASRGFGSKPDGSQPPTHQNQKGASKSRHTPIVVSHFELQSISNRWKVNNQYYHSEHMTDLAIFY